MSASRLIMVLLFSVTVFGSGSEVVNAIRSISDLAIYNFDCGNPQRIGYRITATGSTNDISGFDMLSFRMIDGTGTVILWDTFGIGAAEVNRVSEFPSIPLTVNVAQNPIRFEVYEASQHGEFGAFLISASFQSPCVASSGGSNSSPPNVPSPTQDIPDYCGGSSRPVGNSLRITANPNLNIRSGPGTTYSRIGRAAFNCYFELTSGPRNGWYEINLGSTRGWVSSQYVEVFQPQVQIKRDHWLEVDPQNGQLDVTISVTYDQSAANAIRIRSASVEYRADGFGAFLCVAISRIKIYDQNGTEILNTGESLSQLLDNITITSLVEDRLDLFPYITVPGQSLSVAAFVTWGCIDADSEWRNSFSRSAEDASIIRLQDANQVVPQSNFDTLVAELVIP